MNLSSVKEHRYVRHADVPAFLSAGWLALDSLRDTHHGAWSVHCVKLCDCPPVVPDPDLDELLEGIRELVRPVLERGVA